MFAGPVVPVVLMLVHPGRAAAFVFVAAIGRARGPACVSLVVVAVVRA
jgi:hypothetical protein